MATEPGRPQTLDPQLVDEMVGDLQARLPRIVPELMAMYRARIPSYALAPDDFLEEVESGTTASFQVGLEILRGEMDPSRLRQPLIDIGRRRASQGIPLGDALLAWQISTRTFWTHALDIAPADPNVRSEAMRLATAVIFELLELAVSAVSEGYLEAEQARLVDEEHDIQTIVETLAGMREEDHVYKGAIARRHLDPASLDRCLVCMSSDDIGGAIRALRLRSPGAVVGRLGSFVVAFGSSDGPGIDAPSPAGLADNSYGDGYEHALAAFRVAERLGRPLVRYEEVVPLALIMEAPVRDREAFVRAHLGSLLDDNLATELVATLRAYYAAGQSVAAAARALHIHRHTVEYRLRRIEGLLSTDVKDPDRRLLVELALTFADDPAS